MSKISTIIPAYQSARDLPRVLEACSRQTLAPHEIIVVDDGSTDATPDVCRAHAATIDYIRLENGGVARARNIGARRATGDLLLFLDADDILLPHALATLAEGIQREGAGVTYGMVIDRRPPPDPPRLSGLNFAAGNPPLPAERNFWRCAIITPGSALVRADIHREAGGFVTGYEPMEDRDYWVKCGLLSKVTHCDTVVLDKTWHPASHGSQHAKRIFRGQIAQRALRQWCRTRGIPAPWIPDDAEILRRALNEACWRSCHEIIPVLRREARSAGVFHWRSLPFILRPAPPEPAWMQANPAILDQ